MNRHCLLGELQWQGLNLLPVAVLVAAVGLVAIIWLYLPQLRQMKRIWRWVLPSLRMGVVLAVAVAILRPVVVRQRGAGDGSEILILVDQSASMSARDVYRSPAHLVRQAVALGWIDPEEGHVTGAQGVGEAEGAGGEVPDQQDAAGSGQMWQHGPRSGQGENALEEMGVGEALAMMRWLDRVQVLSESVGRTAGEVDYARFVSRGMETAQQRQDQAVAAMKEVMNHAPVSDATSASILQQIQLLKDAMNQPVDRAWLPGAREAIERLYQTAERHRTAAEQRMYDDDPSVRARASGLPEMSRLALVQQAIFQKRTGLLDRLPADMNVIGYGFAGDQKMLDLKQLAGEGGGSILANGARTDLAGALTEAMRQARKQPLEAVIVFSDGRQVGAEASMPSAIGGLDVPVLAVQAAPANALRDVSIAQVTVPSVLYPGQLMRVHAQVSLIQPAVNPTDLAGVLEEPLPDHPVVTVTARAGDSTDAKPVELVPGQSVGVDFDLVVKGQGMVPVMVSTSTLAGEASTENNTMRRMVKVLGEGLRVGVYAGGHEGVPNSTLVDYLALRENLKQVSWVDEQGGLISRQSPMPLSADDIARLDVLILFHVPAVALSADQWDAVHRMVAHRGGSLVLVAGSEQWAASSLAEKQLSRMLPFSAEDVPTWRTWLGDKPGFGLAPASDAQMHLLQPDNAVEDQLRWNQLPGLVRVMPLAKIKPNARAVLVDRDSEMPVLVETDVDEGKAFFLGCDQLWRWGDAATIDRFWRQLIRQGTSSPYVSHVGAWSMDVAQANVNPGDMVTVRVKYAPTQQEMMRQEGSMQGRSQLGMDAGGAENESTHGAVDGSGNVVMNTPRDTELNAARDMEPHTARDTEPNAARDGRPGTTGDANGDVMREGAGRPAGNRPDEQMGQLPAQGKLLPVVLVQRQGRIEQSIACQPVGEVDSGLFQVSFPAGGAGDMQLTLQAVDNEAMPQATVQVIDPLEREMANLSGDDALLGRMASLSGGSMLGLEDVGRLLEKLAELRAARPVMVEDRLWDSPFLFMFVLGCLAAEWGLRKHLGMT